MRIHLVQCLKFGKGGQPFMGNVFVKLDTTLSVDQWTILHNLFMKVYYLDERELEVLNKLYQGIEFGKAPEIDPFAVDDLPL